MSSVSGEQATPASGVRDVPRRLAMLLDRVAADGGKVVSVAALRRILSGQPDPPARSRIHIIEFHRGSWTVWHPETCVIADCQVTAAASRTILSPYADGLYEAWPGVNGWLCTQAVQP